MDGLGKFRHNPRSFSAGLKKKLKIFSWANLTVRQFFSCQKSQTTLKLQTFSNQQIPTASNIQKKQGKNR
jgi:hypothetical protein